MRRGTATRGLLAMAVLLAVTGCRLGGGSAPPLDSAISETGQAGRGIGQGAAPEPDRRLGTLVIAVRWPDRNLGAFRAAAIPTSTQAIHVRISRGSDLVAERLVRRSGSEPKTQLTFRLEAESNLSVDVRAYREAEPDLLADVPIARGTAVVNIVAAQVTAQPIRLDALFAPAIMGLSQNAGKVGDAIVVSGANLSPVPGQALQVTFNGTAAEAVTPVSSSSLQVVVPAGATTGPLIVTNDGVPSASEVDWWVASALAIDATRSLWDSSPDESRMVLAGTQKQIQHRPTWVLAEGASHSAYGTPPLPAWVLSNREIGQLDRTGLLTAGAGYQVSDLHAEFGTLRSNKLVLSAHDVQVRLSPATASVGAVGGPAVRLTAFNLFSDGSTNSLVTLSSSDPSLLAVDAAGLASPSADAAAFRHGTVTITATPKGDARRSALATVSLTNGVLDTVAGGTQGYREGSPGALPARFRWPYGLDIAPDGTIYVADYWYCRIRKITADGQVSTLAGRGGAGFGDGPGSLAVFNGPVDVAVAPDGAVYVSDFLNHRIRKVQPDGTVSTFAGRGSAGFADGNAANAFFNYPAAIAFDAGGNLLVADSSNHRVRRISPAGAVTTYAGDGVSGSTDGLAATARFNRPYGLAVDGQGTVYVSELGYDLVRAIDSSGMVSTVAGFGDGDADGTGRNARFRDPIALAAGGDGTLYVADLGNHKVRQIKGGTVTTYAGLLGAPGLVDGPSQTAMLNSPGGIAIDSAGNVYVGDTRNHLIRKIALDRVVSTYAGSWEGFADGPAVQGGTALFDGPSGVAVLPDGRIAVCDTGNNRVRLVGTDGSTTVLAGSGERGMADAKGTAASFSSPSGLVAGTGGALFVADTGNHAIRKIEADGTVTTLAGDGTSGFQDAAGRSARFYAPEAIATGPDGMLWVADTGNHAIRRVTPDGTVTTAAGESAGYADGKGSLARFSAPGGIAVAPDGRVIVADTGNHAIRAIDAGGDVSTLAGNGTPGSDDGAAANARFKNPCCVAIDRAGTVFISDTGNALVRRVASDGRVTRVVGTTSASTLTPSDGIGELGQMIAPAGLAAAPDGTIYLADKGNHAIRRIRILP